VETRNGKQYIVHKVEPKETLFALSRKYGVPVAQILEANPRVEAGINIDQLLFIPRKVSALPKDPATVKSVPNAATRPADAVAISRTYTVNESGQKIHVVEPKQTLFSLSRMYSVSMEDIRKWNNLLSENIQIGAHLIVGHNGVASKAPIYIPESDDAVQTNKGSGAENSLTFSVSKIETEESKGKEDAKPYVIKKEESEEMPSPRISDHIGKVVETGLAEVIDQKGDVNKYLELHRTAPVGTILQVKNIMNGQSVYVRVIGNLPDTGTNEKVIVKVSKKAYQKLAAIDNRFRVELSYMP
jgi:LysM repeat protein